MKPQTTLTRGSARTRATMTTKFLGVVAGAALAFGLASPTAQAQSAGPCGAVQVAAGAWLGGGGVDVRSNGANQGNGYSCAGFSTANPARQYGYGFQCVELAARLYAVKGWGRVYAKYDKAAFIPDGSPDLAFHPNGAGYVPVPGDLVIFSATTGNPYGHVAIVDTVVGGAVNVVEQNASASGRRQLSLAGSTLAGGVKGTLHSPKNGNTNAAAGNSSFLTAFAANTNDLWNVDGQRPANHGLGMMPGTSPAVTSLKGGGYQIAFQANTGALWTVGSRGTKNWGLGMMRGTSPAITGLAGGGYQVAFQANTGNLWTVGEGAGSFARGDRGLGMMAGTSPAITALPAGGFEMAFQANTGALWTVGEGPGSRTHGDWRLGMMRGTSPSIAGLPGGGIQVAFQANTGSLWTVGEGGGSMLRGDRRLGMMAGTSPSIAALPSGGFEIAFQANTGHLWTVGENAGSITHGSWGLGMMRGTSPAVTGLPGGGYEVAFQANTGELWNVGEGGGSATPGRRGLGMNTSTTPAISAWKAGL